ncbi:MAG: hypothetical protein EOR12_16630 [Mesorhizobium sp.]|uniref:hypothetical protein n=1 Tax=Mesorhizobium sp. TaxID=1871066 RepID=UPI000FE55E71|nr:hypothetical protein [Mesorhizobium sp.]RWP88338.1 MAG: hypothetical protein EOR12_16630 [Mesorhizobium sp.]
MGTGDFIVLALAGFLGGFVFLFGTDFALTHAAWCISGEEHCIREWVGASSGWAAAAAAALTIGFLAKQAADARRQTEFIVGDSAPTITVAPNPRGLPDFDIRIVNWNRHAVAIKSIEIESTPPGVVWGLVETRFIDPENRNDLQVAQLNAETGATYPMPGWEDRELPPWLFTAGILLDATKLPGGVVTSLRVTAVLRTLSSKPVSAQYSADTGF